MPAHAPPHNPSQGDEFQYMNEFNDEDFKGSGKVAGKGRGRGRGQGRVG